MAGTQRISPDFETRACGALLNQRGGRGCAATVGPRLRLGPHSDAATLRGAAAVVRLRRHIVDRADLEACGLERTDGGLASRAGALDEDVHLLHAVLLCLARGRLGGELRGERGRLAAALEADATRGGPADHGAGGVRDGNDRVVERRL